MEQLVMVAMNVCQEYARKSASQVLTEYEVQLYEQAARTSRAYLRSVENSFRMGLIDQEKELDDKLRGKEGEDDGDPTPAPKA